VRPNLDHRFERGRSSVDLIMGLVLFSLVVMSVYQVFIPTLVLSRNTTERLDKQQDVRLAIDRLARDLNETTMRDLVVYLPTDGCSGPYQGCIGFPTARDSSCSGVWPRVDPSTGYPDWQATIYVWRDTATNELRRRCDTTTTRPASAWSSTIAVSPFTVVARDVVEVRFTRLGTGVELFLRERATIAAQSARRYQTEFVNQTVFVPQNR